MGMIVYVEEADSTNNLLAKSASKFEHGSALAAHRQTAGKGQRGNHWESEPRKNLTFSMILRPVTIIASHQFELLQLVALSIVKVLRKQLNSDEVYIKWPNDIYYRDSKLVGILIENVLQGNKIQQSIVGIGINVNQEKFFSDAPNPISMCNIADRSFDLDPLLEEVVNQIVEDFDDYEIAPNSVQLAAKYRFLLWRGEGYWPYHDNLTNEDFEARIAAVDPMGFLTLEKKGGTFRTYAFKEVSAVL